MSDIDKCQHCQKQRMKKQRQRKRDDPNYCVAMKERWLRWTVKQNSELAFNKGMVKVRQWENLELRAARNLGLGRRRVNVVKFPGNERE